MVLGVDNVCNQCRIVRNAADSRCRLKGVKMEKTSFDFVEGQLVQLFHSRPEDAWDIYDVTNDKLIEALYWNDPNGDFDELPREKLLEIFLADFVVNRSN